MVKIDPLKLQAPVLRGAVDGVSDAVGQKRGAVRRSRETRRTLRELAYYSSLGLSVALAIFIGVGIGVYLDRRFDTSPWLMFVGLVLGIAAGYRNIGLAIRKARKL